MLKTSEKTSSLVDVARLYYEHDFSQQDIAKKLGISRPSVSRMLQKAREMGIIRIKIFDPEQRGSHQEKALQNIYGLKKVILVPNEDATDLVIKQRLGFVAAKGRGCGGANSNQVLFVFECTYPQRLKYPAVPL